MVCELCQGYSWECTCQSYDTTSTYRQPKTKECRAKELIDKFLEDPDPAEAYEVLLEVRDILGD